SNLMAASWALALPIVSPMVPSATATINASAETVFFILQPLRGIETRRDAAKQRRLRTFAAPGVAAPDLVRPVQPRKRRGPTRWPEARNIHPLAGGPEDFSGEDSSAGVVLRADIQSGDHEPRGVPDAHRRSHPRQRRRPRRGAAVPGRVPRGPRTGEVQGAGPRGRPAGERDRRLADRGAGDLQLR